MSDIASDLHRAIQSVRSKYLLAKRARLLREQINEDLFKPITSRLDVLRTPDDSPVIVKTEEEDGNTKKRKRNVGIDDRDGVADLELQHKTKLRRKGLEPSAPVRRYLTSYTSRINDTTYGVYRYNGKWYLGAKEIHFLPGDIIQVEDYTTHGTPGLYELLFRKDSKGYVESDLQEYKKLLELTHAHYRDNDPESGAYKDEEHEKINILADLFSELAVKTGDGLRKLEDNKDVDYVFWDDPNELVDRLRLLIASQSAGNYSHTNEIISILEELREGGYIL